jgi:hypothetical protein
MRFFRGSVIPVWVGIVVAGLAITIVEFLGSKVYPPLGMNPEDPASVRAAMALMPPGALLFVLLGWIVGTFAGAWVTARMVYRSPITHGLVLGAIFLAGSIVNMLLIPHPVWFWVLGVAVFLPSAYLGAKLGAGSGAKGRALAEA